MCQFGRKQVTLKLRRVGKPTLIVDPQLLELRQAEPRKRVAKDADVLFNRKRSVGYLWRRAVVVFHLHFSPFRSIP